MPEEERDVARVVEEFPESVGLTKNSRGYTWDLKIRARHGKLEESISRIEDINKIMLEKFGNLA